MTDDQATVWYTPMAGGSYLRAHLLDGLHVWMLSSTGGWARQLLKCPFDQHQLMESGQAELLLQLGAELAHRMYEAWSM